MYKLFVASPDCVSGALEGASTAGFLASVLLVTRSMGSKVEQDLANAWEDLDNMTGKEIVVFVTGLSRQTQTGDNKHLLGHILEMCGTRFPLTGRSKWNRLETTWPQGFSERTGILQRYAVPVKRLSPRLGRTDRLIPADGVTEIREALSITERQLPVLLVRANLSQREFVIQLGEEPRTLSPVAVISEIVKCLGDFGEEGKPNSLSMCPAIEKALQTLRFQEIDPGASLHHGIQRQTFAIIPTRRADESELTGALARVLLCTATDKEDERLVTHLKKSGISTKLLTRHHCAYRDLGVVGNCELSWVRSGMGTAGSSGSLATTQDAIDAIKPNYVISCGLAFGHSPKKQNLGDVLVSEWIRAYEAGRQGDPFVPRGERMPADPLLLQVARAVSSWGRYGFSVHFGGLLSGEKLVDDAEFKKKLWQIEPEAIGGEMEGCGIMSACYRRKVGWLLVKAICDWGEHKTSKAQPLALENALNFVFEILNTGTLSKIP